MNTKTTWVETWGMAHSAMSLMGFLPQKRTIRLVINSAISGEGARIRLCNKYSRSTVKILAASIAPCDAEGRIKNRADITPLLFGGNPGAEIAPGETLISDGADFSVQTGEYICVSVYASGALRSGNNCSGAKILFAKKDMTASPRFTHRERPRNSVILAAGKILGMSLGTPVPLIQSVELLNTEGAGAIACFGDSITQQGFWVMDFEKKIRALYPGRYSVVNKAVTGNRILHDASKKMPLRGFFGIKALERIHDDVFAFEGVSRVMLCLGVNDCIQPGTGDAPASEFVSAEEICDGIEKLALMIKERGIKLGGLNYIPLGLRKRDAGGEKPLILAEINEFLMSCPHFDMMADVRTPFADKGNPALPDRRYVGGDKAHPNAAGGAVMAGAVDYSFFE